MELYSQNIISRPVTQAHFIVEQTKPSPNPTKILRESFHDSPKWDPGYNRPLTISSTKPSYGRVMTNYQPTCYGAFRAAIKVIGKPIKQSAKATPASNAYGAITAENFFPSSGSIVRNQKHPRAANKAVNANFYGSSAYYNDMSPVPIAATGENMLQKLHRRVTTSECRRSLRQYPKSLLPLLYSKGRLDSKGDPRPCTGNFNAKTAPEPKPESKAHRMNPELRVGTAQIMQRAKLAEPQQQKHVRVSTPQTSEKRPESRYNKETLYTKLEHGRGNSPEYEVPIIDMRFEEVAGQQIIPECWK